MDDDSLISLDAWRRDHLPWRLGELAGAVVDGGLATKDEIQRAVRNLDESEDNRLVGAVAAVARVLVEDGIAPHPDVTGAVDDQLADADERLPDDPFGQWGADRFDDH